MALKHAVNEEVRLVHKMDFDLEYTDDGLLRFNLKWSASRLPDGYGSEVFTCTFEQFKRRSFDFSIVDKIEVLMWRVNALSAFGGSRSKQTRLDVLR